MNERIKMNKIIAFLAAFAIIFVVIIIDSLFIKWFWNAVMPDIFGLQQVTWEQAFFLSGLSSMLFKSKNIKQNNED